MKAHHSLITFCIDFDFLTGLQGPKDFMWVPERGVYFTYIILNYGVIIKYFKHLKNPFNELPSFNLFCIIELNNETFKLQLDMC